MAKFIVRGLMSPVRILFSVRQGDPIAMLLYLIFVEPLLLQLRTRVEGLRVGPMRASDEEYVDDVNLILSSDYDFFVVDKSKVLGLGTWAGCVEWPLKWLKVEDKLKVFGFWWLPEMKKILQVNWEEVVSNLQKVLASWASRRLDTLAQRVKVLHTFGFSMLWYKAQLLPMPVKIVKKVEKLVRGFLWQGHLEKIKIEELFAKPVCGGLGLVCLEAKVDALRLKQLFRLLLAPQVSTYHAHVRYWLGLQLKNWFPCLNLGPHPEVVPKFYKELVVLWKECVNLA